MGVPTFYTRLLQSPSLTKETTKHMRLFISGSAPLLADTHREWSARTGFAILERYGMTETNMNTSNPYDGDRVPGAVGHPLPPPARAEAERAPRAATKQVKRGTRSSLRVVTIDCVVVFVPTFVLFFF